MESEEAFRLWHHAYSNNYRDCPGLLEGDMYGWQAWQAALNYAGSKHSDTIPVPRELWNTVVAMTKTWCGDKMHPELVEEIERVSRMLR